MNQAKHTSKYLSFLITILIALTASTILWFIQTPFTTYATPDELVKIQRQGQQASRKVTSTPNGKFITAEDTRESYDFGNGNVINGEQIDTGDTAGYLYWAASSDRTGILFYVLDNYGKVYRNKSFLILDDPMYYNDSIAKGSKFIKSLSPAAGYSTGIDVTVKQTPTGEGLSSKPVRYDDSWKSSGTIDSLLLATTEYNGEEVPYWYRWAGELAGGSEDILKVILESNSNWTVVAEPVSIQYIYTNSKFPTSIPGDDIEDASHKKDNFFAAGSPLPLGSWVTQDASYAPNIYCGTARNLASLQNIHNLPTGSQYTFKFLNKALPWSMCLEHDQDVDVKTQYGGLTEAWGPPKQEPGSLLSNSEITKKGNGVGIYFIDVSAMRPPIHTYDEAKGSPGDPETPDPDLHTDGKCTIRKLYYTKLIKSDGTTELKDFIPRKMEGTTNIIEVMDEPGDYSLEGWVVPEGDPGLNTKEDFDSIPKNKENSGTSSTTVTIPEGGVIYVLLQKVETEPSEDAEYDFILQESQITKRVNFLEGTSRTQSLITHSFTWHADEPYPKECLAHGGYGHHPACGYYEGQDIPNTGVYHTHDNNCLTNGCPFGGAEGQIIPPDKHTHTDSCYDTPCSNWQWTDNQVQLGLAITKSSLTPSVVSKNYEVHSPDDTFATMINSSLYKYYKEVDPARTGNSPTDTSLTGFNTVLVL